MWPGRWMIALRNWGCDNAPHIPPDADLSPADILATVRQMDDEMIKTALQAILTIALIAFTGAFIIAVYQYNQTGNYELGESIARAILDALALLFNVILRTEIKLNFASILIIVLTTAWLSQPGNQKKIRRIIR